VAVRKAIEGIPMSEKNIVDVVKLNLRLPKALHRKLSQAAKTNNVSLNTEIINQLEGVPTTVKNLIQATATATAERMRIVGWTGKSGEGQ
jgi:predicted HicB family RNase H-like nuclease